ncbi:hypothetical protein B0H10DRAFT_2237042 [Mycena sp. CBHHK59/15]|nr:hypothetical protein B0H10DRAFT_2237042 [Mycena sp. CBHHK59/15]
MITVVFSDPAAAPTLLSATVWVVVHACPQLLEHKFRISGVAVLDIVEGSAKEVLPHMHNLLNARPDGFDSPEAAIEWHVKTKTICNANSAHLSIPAIIVPAATPSPDRATYQWRTLLRSTAPYWPNWLTGLSGAFLAARTACLLLLAFNGGAL